MAWSVIMLQLIGATTVTIKIIRNYSFYMNRTEAKNRANITKTDATLKIRGLHFIKREKYYIKIEVSIGKYCVKITYFDNLLCTLNLRE